MDRVNYQPICVEEDEIDLKELFATIWRYKLFVLIFVFIVTGLAILYALSQPNKYKVYTLLAPQGQQKSVSLGALASIAGINIGGGGGEVTPDIAFENLLKNYPFMKEFIIKNGFDKKLLSGELERDYVFAYGYDKLYKLLHKKGKRDQIDFYMQIYKPFTNMISIVRDKKSGLINISVTHPNRFFAYEVLKAFLKDGTKYLVNKNLQDINAQIKKYQKELASTNNLELKSELAKLISSLIKQKVYINTSKYYKVKVIVDPYVPDIKDKVGPKRSLIVVVAFITSFILAIFLVFLIEFIRGEN